MNEFEEWKPIIDDRDDFTGLYEVSSLGKIRNCRTNTELKPNKTVGGYCMVQLRRKGKRYPKMISRLVAFAFVENPNPTEKIQVNHLSEDKNDNRACNLEWVTPRENANYGTRNKRLSAIKGFAVEQIDLSTNKVINTFASVKEAKNETNIRTIWETLNGKQHQSGGYGWRLATDRR